MSYTGNDGFKWGTPNSVYKSTVLETGFGLASSGISEIIFGGISRNLRYGANSWWREGNRLSYFNRFTTDGSTVLRVDSSSLFHLKRYDNLMIHSKWINSLSVPGDAGSSTIQNIIEQKTK